MELLLSLLTLIANTLEELGVVLSRQGVEGKREAGKQLASYIVMLDKILSRGEIIITEIDKLASENSISKENSIQFKEMVLRQRKDVGMLAQQLGGYKRSKKTHERVEKVMSIFGDGKKYSLDSLTSGKHTKLGALLVLFESTFSVDQSQKLIINHYQPNCSLDEYYGHIKEQSENGLITDLVLEKLVIAGLITKIEINLRNQRERKKYLSGLSDQLSHLRKDRERIVKLIRDNFEIEDVV